MLGSRFAIQSSKSSAYDCCKSYHKALQQLHEWMGGCESKLLENMPTPTCEFVGVSQSLHSHVSRHSMRTLTSLSSEGLRQSPPHD